MPTRHAFNAKNALCDQSVVRELMTQNLFPSPIVFVCSLCSVHKIYS